MTEPIVYLNDGFLPASQAKLNIYDLGIVLGATLTEMTRTFRHQPFCAGEHVARLYRSLKYSGIEVPLSPEEMLALTHELAAENCKLLQPNEDIGIVHFVTPGENAIYAGSAGLAGPMSPTICIHSFPLRFSMWKHLFVDGAHVVTPSIRHIPPQCIEPKMKNRSRLHWFLADKQSQAVDPRAITLLLDLDGNVTECAGSNFVIIKDRTIITPTTRNILWGISLQTVKELAAGIGMEFLEKDFQPYDVINADEAWLTTTPYCLAPCTKINNIPIGNGKPGPGFKAMLAAWSRRVGMDIEAQVMKLLLPILLLAAATSRGADETALHAAAEKSLPLLERSSIMALEERSDCFTCHHSGLPVMAFITARERGFTVDEGNLNTQLQFTADVLAKGRANYLEGKGQGGAAFMAGSALWTLKLGGWKADANTEAVVEYLLGHQEELNHWEPPSIRPPSEESPFSATYFALEGILHFATEAQKPRMAARVSSALEWLEKTAAQTTEDRVFRLQALRAAGADVAGALADLLRTQRDDGGWAQLETMGTDAYATATALVALHRAGGIPVNEGEYQRGIAWLLANQLPDGSWHVVSRSDPIQKYFESGYPHGRDQFISITAAAWATTALLDAMELVLHEAGAASLTPQALKEAADKLKENLGALKGANPDHLADAAVFHKAVEWALRYETALTPADLTGLGKALQRGSERVATLAADQSGWTAKQGKVVRGFVSAVDGSTQPYGLIIPKSYDGTSPIRLDVVLHGSSKPVGMSEWKFMSRFDGGDGPQSEPGPEADFIELHPLGRVENCYRWAGETDVFEAIEAVCRNYRIDRDRIVLRGMSMGASGTWHLGLKHPDRFVAIGPYCGYVDTHRFSETPVPGFIRVGPLPPHQEMGLHLLDSVDYAANAGVVPAIAAIGDQDVFFQSHVHMAEAFAREGLQMVNLISHGTGHVIDPMTHALQMERIGEYAEKGLDHDPKELRFVTWSLKYHRCHWLELLALGKHYERAEFRATVGADGTLEVAEVRNITRFAIHRPLSAIRIDGAAVSLPLHQPDEALVFSRRDGAWQCDGLRREITLTGKRPGLQGPIDDAFATPFLCVRGTGTPWNAEVDAWAAASLRRFEYEWARYMRGDLPVKNDTEVTEADLRDKHLILFGDPGSNAWIAKALPGLPVNWNRDELRLGDEVESSTDHAPAFLFASPFDANRYLVINSGHTFHEAEFAAFNYLLFPRLGDWAVVKVAAGADQWQPGASGFPESIVRAGYFDESWRKAELVEP